MVGRGIPTVVIIRLSQPQLGIGWLAWAEHGKKFKWGGVGGEGESVPKMKKCVIQNVDFLRLRGGGVQIFRYFQMCMYTLNLSFNKKKVLV